MVEPGGGGDEAVFEIGVVVSKGWEMEENDEFNCIEVLVNEFKKMGLIVDREVGLQNEYIKLSAPLDVLEKAVVELQLNKQVGKGTDSQSASKKPEASINQTDDSLSSWCERFRCYNCIIYNIVNTSKSGVTLKSDRREVQWESGESLLGKLKSMGIVKDVFPLHDERKRKKLIRNWALDWCSIAAQPLDEIYSYFGTKIAIYFGFLGMYTRWMLFPAALGLVAQAVDFGSMQVLVLPLFVVSVISWAVLYFQFWKRKNSEFLARWQMSNSSGEYHEDKLSYSTGILPESRSEIMKKFGEDKSKEKYSSQRNELLRHLKRFRNDAIMISSIICLQFPFELVYAHLYEIIDSSLLKFPLTAVYLYAIQYFTKKVGKISVKLAKRENHENAEYLADSLIYKVFGLYFMQTYIGVFYHAFLHRNFMTLRQLLIQRLIISEVLGNLMENSLPYLRYIFKKQKAVQNKRKRQDGRFPEKDQSIPKVEKEYLKPAYSASIGQELEDGLFDDFLELTLQFGMVMMFACAFPLGFVFSLLSNLSEIRADALKMLALLRRPAPRADATIGAWLNIFQFLIVVSICTNSVLLIWLYDKEGEWKISSGLVAILAMEHVLLFIKFGFSRIIPEESAWVRAKRTGNVSHAQETMHSNPYPNPVSHTSFGDKSTVES